MFHINLFTVAVLMTTLIISESSWSSEKKNLHNYDVSNMSDLRKLYNSKVKSADWMIRPLEGQSFQFSIYSHSGVRVTLEDETSWLLHKGDGFGFYSQTVVVDARHMSSKWKILETKYFDGQKTVSDFVNAGGPDYSLFSDNCHHAAGRMMN